MFEKIKDYYDQGLWGEPRVRGMVIRRILTPEEYGSIIGEPIGEWEPDDSTMIGSTETTDGKKGFVPAPDKGPPNRFLNSSGIWTPPMGGSADTVDGFHASIDDIANDIVVRGTDKSINVGAIISDAPNDEEPSISQVIVTNGTDDTYRKASLQHLKNSMGIGRLKSGALFVFSTSSKSMGATWYLNFMDVDTSGYAFPIVFWLVSRGGNTIMARIAPTVSREISFVCTPGTGRGTSSEWADKLYYVKTGTSRYSIYARCHYWGGEVTVFGVSMSVPFENKNIGVSSLPTGAVESTQVSNMV